EAVLSRQIAFFPPNRYSWDTQAHPPALPPSPGFRGKCPGFRGCCRRTRRRGRPRSPLVLFLVGVAMTLRSRLALIIVVGVIGGAGYVLVFEREWLFGLFRKGIQQAKGYTPAKTPQEAMDKFKAAVKERDYESAALYCGPDYAEQLRKAAPVATP